MTIEKNTKSLNNETEAEICVALEESNRGAPVEGISDTRGTVASITEVTVSEIDSETADGQNNTPGEDSMPNNVELPNDGPTTERSQPINDNDDVSFVDGKTVTALISVSSNADLTVTSGTDEGVLPESMLEGNNEENREPTESTSVSEESINTTKDVSNIDDKAEITIGVVASNGDLIIDSRTKDGVMKEEQQTTESTSTKNESTEKNDVNNDVNGISDASSPATPLEENEQASRGVKRTHDDLSSNERGENLEAGEKTESEKPPSPKVSKSENFAYRLLRENEIPGSTLYPKAPHARVTVDEHVASGSSQGFKSQYISASDNIFAVGNLVSQKRKGNTRNIRIVKIDLDKIPSSNIIDLTKQHVRDLHLTSYLARKYARQYDEIIIEGSIPSNAYETIYSGSKNNCPYII